MFPVLVRLRARIEVPSFALALEIAAMRHARLEARLFRS